MKPFARIEVVSGGRYLAELTGLPRKMSWADLVITGEGGLDRQTLGGKAVKVISELAREAGRPCWAVVGGCEAGMDFKKELGLEQIIDLTAVSGSRQEAIARPAHWIAEGVKRAVAV